MCLVFFYSESVVQQGRTCHPLLSLSNTEQLLPRREHIASLFLEQIKASSSAQNTTSNFTSWYRKVMSLRASFYTGITLCYIMPWKAAECNWSMFTKGTCSSDFLEKQQQLIIFFQRGTSSFEN